MTRKASVTPLHPARDVRHVFRDAARAAGRDSRGDGEQLYLRIGAAVRQHIRDGSLPPGAALPPHRELSQIMRIGEVTIRRAMQTLADEGLIEARPRAGTFVLQPGRSGARKPVSLPTNRQSFRTLGIAFTDLANGYPFFRPLVDGLRDGAGLSIRLIDLPPATSTRTASPDLRGLDGLLMMSPVNLRLLVRCHDNRLPCVALFADIADARTPCVLADYAPGMMAAMRHLADRRRPRKRVALLTAGVDRFSTGQLVDAFRTALDACEINFDPSQMAHAAYDAASAAEAIRTLFARRGEKPDAIVCASDDQARGVLAALKSMGRRVPRDVSVVAAAHAGSADPELSAIDLRFDELGALALESIRLQRAGDAVPVRQSVRSQFVARGSS